MTEEIKDGDILDLMDKVGKKFSSDKEKQRLLVIIYNVLKQVKNNTNPILHLCDDCKMKTMDNARTKAKELGVEIQTEYTVELKEDLSMASN